MRPSPFKRIDDMDLYEVLDIGQDASTSAVAEAYRKAVECLSPRGPDIVRSPGRR